MNWLSDHARGLLTSEGQALDAVQFEELFVEIKSAHNRKLMKDYVIAVLCFIGGLWALSANFNVVGAGLLVAALWCNLNSIHHSLIADVLDLARMLSMRINAVHNQVEPSTVGRRGDAT